MLKLKDKIKAQTEKKRAGVARAPTRETVEFVAKAKKLGQILKSGHLERAVRVWIDGLEATKKEYEKVSETWSEVPDWKERRECANMIVAYMEGRPVERQLVIGGSFEDLNAAMGKVKASPEAMRLLESMGGALGVQETGSEKQADVTREE